MRYRDSSNKQEIVDILEKFGQTHVLRFWEKLNGEQRQKLLDQIAEIDFELLERLIKKALDGKDKSTDVKLEPAEFITIEQRKTQDKKALSVGEEALRSGKVAAVLVAGGQVTRLGYDGPKGMFPVTPVKKKSLFQVHTEKLRAMSARYDAMIPWYIMTSETNHAATVAFFEENSHFGYDPDDIMFFTQEMIPAIDRQGKLILDAPGHIFTNPNGHGGSLKALWSSGALADMKKRGIENIFYFQVDNVLTRICDPVYIGYHIMGKSEMSNKVVRKKSPEEKMGVLCRINGKLGLIEYSDISDEDMHARNADGTLRFWAGNIATHILSVSFVERENKEGFRLPYHVAEKRILYIDDQGRAVEPKEKNGIKFESFVFDALQDAQRSVSIEIAREKEFSPLKNSTGENSPKTVHQHQNNIYGHWLAAAGFPVLRDNEGNVIQNIEISPLFALDGEEIIEKKEKVLMREKDIYLE